MNRAATYVISIIAVTLLIYNQVLISKIKEERKTNAELVDRFFDIQMRYDGLWDEVLRLEEENQILGSFAALSEIADEELKKMNPEHLNEK